VDIPEDVFFNYFLTAPALYRLDLRKGKVTTTLSPFSGGILPGYNASFSPTDRHLAYVASNDPRVVNVYDLQSGEIFTITVDEQYIASGNFTWSKDGNQIVFMAVKYGWPHEERLGANGVSYFLLDVGEHTSLHIFDQEEIYPISWTEDGNIVLHRIYDGETLVYHLKRNKFTSITPTPLPQ
jgi:Tol biopolymer transport system component